ncbi:MAG: hypothetical protein NTW14_02440 [bacterium]|nr:hypothetical protein [bacterium]
MKFIVRVGIILLIAGITAGSSYAAIDWKAYPAVHTVRSLVRIGDELWGATNAGLVQFNPQTGSSRIFTTVDGLSSNDIRAIVPDGRGNLVLGMGNAYLDIFNLSTHQDKWIPDFKFNTKIFQILALYNDSGSIYIGTDIGVSRLVFYDDLNEYHIQGNYTHLGNFPLEIAVASITINAGGLWVGTQMGLARGDLSSSVLESPSNWSNYTTAQGLSSNPVSALAIIHDTLYVATPSTGLNYQSGSLFIPIPVLYTTGANFLKVCGDTLYFGRPEGLFRLQPGEVVRYGTEGSKGRCVEFDADSTMWAGFEPTRADLGGLRFWQPEGWTTYNFENPLVELPTDILIDKSGSLWVCGTANLGFNNGCLSHFNGQHWINFTSQSDNYLQNSHVSPDSFFWYVPRALTEDFSGSVWVGSDGRGAAWFSFQNDTVIARGFFSAPSGRLFNVLGISVHYCVVRDLTTDAWGNVWICNSEANPLSGQPIAIVPSDYIDSPSDSIGWYYLTPENQNGINLPSAQYYVDRVAEDSYNRKWFGPNNNKGSAIHILDDNGTLSAADDHWYTLENLPSDSINAIVTDQEGVVWVATPSGTQYFYPEGNAGSLIGIDLIIPTGQSVNCIAVDPQNNKWFGTTSGLSVLAADNYTWFNEYNLTSWEGVYPSPLPGNVIQTIAFNPGTGEAFIGTNKGLVSINTPFKQMGTTINSISVWPNPLLVGNDLDDHLSFDAAGLTVASEIKIFTASGSLVRHLQGVQQINQGWDGRNSLGEFVGSGVYLILAYSADGQAKTSKVAVVRQ